MISQRRCSNKRNFVTSYYFTIRDWILPHHNLEKLNGIYPLSLSQLEQRMFSVNVV